MSIFGVQFRSKIGGGDCLEQSLCAPQKPIFACSKKKIQLLNDCCDIPKKECKKDCCKTNDDENCFQSATRPAKSAIIRGERVLRPWAVDGCDCDSCEPLPVCEQICKRCDKKSKIVDCRTTECGSVIVKLLVNGGPEQCLAMFIDLPQCSVPCDEIAFNTRSISVGDGKCIEYCQVPCEFANFKFDRKKGTPSGVHLMLCFSSYNAPKALLQTEGPCCCFVPFCLEFEVWRQPQQPCCLEVETIVPAEPQCTVVDGCCVVCSECQHPTNSCNCTSMRIGSSVWGK